MVYVNKSRAGRISDTVEFFPDHNKIAGVYNQDAATNATNIPICIHRDIKSKYIRKWAHIFKQKYPTGIPPQGDRTNKGRVQK